MRTRVIDDINEYDDSILWFKPSGGTESPAIIASHAVHGKHLSMIDEPHPNYRKRIKSGELIIGPLTRVDEEHTVSGGSGSASSNQGDSWRLETSSATSAAISFWGGAGNFGSLHPLSDTSIALVKNEAIANIDKTEYDFLEDILTWRQNMAFFRDGMSEVAQYTKNMCTDLPNIRKKFRTAASAWAFYRFGITPTMRSMSDLYEALSRESKIVKPNVRLRSTSSESDSFDDTTTSQSTDGGGAVYTFSTSRKSEIKYSAGVFYHVTKVRDGLAYKYGTRYKDLPAGFWAVVPYSFMIDRVFNISNLSKAVINISDPTVIIEGGYVTTKENHSHTIQLTNVTQVPNWTSTWSGDIVHKKYNVINRQRWTPELSDAIPPVNLSGLVSDATKLFDLSALTIQRLNYFRDNFNKRRH